MRHRRYYVNMRTNNFMFEIKCRSLRMAKWFMNLKIWKYAKIHDLENGDICIDFKKRA